MNTDQTCKTCMWFVGGSVEGSCRRYPPVALAVPDTNAMTGRVMGMAIKGFWAPVGAKDWCGEWAARMRAEAIAMPVPQPAA